MTIEDVALVAGLIARQRNEKFTFLDRLDAQRQVEHMLGGRLPEGRLSDPLDLDGA